MTMMVTVIANRKFEYKATLAEKILSSFDGTTVQREASSTHQHARVFNMGNYKNSPFVTGHHFPDDNASGFATEIFNYENSEWVQVQDYPFSTGDS